MWSRGAAYAACVFPVTLIHDKAWQAGLEYLVIGGHAINTYGIPRSTLDMDSPALKATFERYGTTELYERFRQTLAS